MRFAERTSKFAGPSMMTLAPLKNSIWTSPCCSANLPGDNEAPTLRFNFGSDQIAREACPNMATAGLSLVEPAAADAVVGASVLFPADAIVGDALPFPK